MFKADPLMTLFPTHINIAFPNTVMRRHLELSIQLKSRPYSHDTGKTGNGKTSWKSTVS